jgi:cell division protein FtsW
MARKLRSDWWLFVAMLVLVCTSLVMVRSASAFKIPGEPFYFLSKQVAWSLIGATLLILLMRIDYRLYRHPLVVYGALGAVALGLVIVFFMRPANNTHRWLNLAGVGVQPSEFAKLAAIMFTAMMLERRMESINDLRASIVPIVGVASALAMLIFFEPDFGTAAALVVTVAVMLFAAGLSYRYMVALACAVVPVAVVALMAEPYRVARLLSFLDPEANRRGHGWQQWQSLIAVGSGGVTGVGIGNSTQKMAYLPEPHSDFIYAVLSEEAGLIGATVVLIAFCVIAWRGLAAALRAPDRFGAFLALGITAMIVVQAFVNISVVLGLMPTKGIPLPFVSAGGSSLIVSFIAMGVLLNVSQQASANT